MSEKPKVVVIGAGPGGYEAAIMAAKLGADVTVVEKDTLGGTCLNRGCIPTKVFLANAQALNDAKSLGALGFDGAVPALEHAMTLKRKEESVSRQVQGIESLFKRHGVKRVSAAASLTEGGVIARREDGAACRIPADKVIIATGSEPAVPAALKCDGEDVITSNEVLEMESLPESIIIVGGNVVSSEMAQSLARFGVKVTVVEALDHIVPFEDGDVARQLIRQFKREGIKILPKTRIAEVRREDGRVRALTEDGRELVAEKALISIGRVPNTAGLNLEAAGVLTDERGFIITDEFGETTAPGIYAAGDVTGPPMLAHSASHEGLAAARNALGGRESVKSHAVPRCIYTDPEIAAVGKTEEQLKREGVRYKTGKFSLRSLGKAQAMGKTQGFAKVITDESGVILGAALVGHHASDMLGELTLAIDLGLTAAQLASVIHPHPTLSEAVMEACMDVDGMSINKI